MGTPESHEHPSGRGHDHGIVAGADRRYLIGALALLVAFLVGEVIVAIAAGSLALLSDAGHMLTDAGAIAVALWAMRLAARPAAGAWTYGWKRAEILSALGNGVTMLVIAALVLVEAVRRLFDAHLRVLGGPVLVVALVGIVVNLAATWLLARANRSSLNVEGAYQHILTDLYGFIGTAIAAVVILTTGWARADAVASLVVVVLLVRAGWGLLRESGRVLLEAAPAGTDLDGIRRHLLEVDHVHDVHDLHVWTLTSDLPSFMVGLARSSAASSCARITRRPANRASHSCRSKGIDRALSRSSAGAGMRARREAVSRARASGGRAPLRSGMPEP